MPPRAEDVIRLLCIQKLWLIASPSSWHVGNFTPDLNSSHTSRYLTCPTSGYFSSGMVFACM